jgi:PqqD family protein of HPr-rel-A system
MIPKYIRNNKTISGRLHDEMVMMDIDQGKYFSLNQSATAIWELLENPITSAELCRKLMEEYDVDPEQCKKEVQDHLNEMEKLGLVLRNEK